MTKLGARRNGSGEYHTPPSSPGNAKIVYNKMRGFDSLDRSEDGKNDDYDLILNFSPERNDDEVQRLKATLEQIEHER